VLPKVSKLT